MINSTSLYVELVYEKNNRSKLFSGSRKVPTLGSTVQRESRQAFPTGTVGHRVGIFLSQLNTNDGFYLCHITVPPRGIDKKPSRTLAALWPHVESRRHCNVIMTSPFRISASSGFSGSLFIFFQYEMGYLVMSKKKNPVFV